MAAFGADQGCDPAAFVDSAPIGSRVRHFEIIWMASHHPFHEIDLLEGCLHDARVWIRRHPHGPELTSHMTRSQTTNAGHRWRRTVSADGTARPGCEIGAALRAFQSQRPRQIIV